MRQRLVQDPAGRHLAVRAVRPLKRPARRVLVTGSRTWTDTALIHSALAAVWHQDSNPGQRWVSTRRGPPRQTVLDPLGRHRRTLASRLDGARPYELSGQSSSRTIGWHPLLSACGLARNRMMIGAGAVLCLAFIRQDSPGATHCASLAQCAGIHTRICRS